VVDYKVRKQLIRANPWNGGHDTWCQHERLDISYNVGKTMAIKKAIKNAIKTAIKDNDKFKKMATNLSNFAPAVG
jgi:hypothetical protein